MRSPAFMLLAGAMILGCNRASAPPAPVPSQAPAPPPEVGAFERLTANEWGDERTRLVLNRDGRYAWTQMPGPPCGTPDFDREGAWSLEWHGGQGLVTFEGGEVAAIRFEGRDLRFIGSILHPGDPIPDPLVDGPRTPAELPRLRKLPLWEELTATPWRRTNDFNLAISPDALEFGRDGRYRAGYRRGAGGHGGLWSLELRGPYPVVTAVLVQVPDPNDDDLRTPAAESTQYSIHREVDIAGGVLRVNADSYYRADDATPVRLFTFDSYRRSVRCTGRWTGPFRARQPKELELTFENDDPRRGFTKELQSLRLTETPGAFQGRSFTNAGAPRLLVEVPLDFRLADGEKRVHRVQVTPTIPGEHVYLQIEFSFKDLGQPYTARQTYIVPVE